MLFALITLIIIVKGDSYQSLLENVREVLTGEQCPYNGVRGLSSYCKENTNLKRFNVQYLRAKVGLGWDSISNSVKLPILKLTYEGNNTYKSHSGMIYKVPHQITLNHKNISASVVNSQRYNTIYEYLDKSSKIDSLSIIDMPEIIQQFSHGNNIITNTEEIHHNLDLEYTSDYVVNEYVLDAINSLPLTYNEETKKSYELFKRYFGDRIITKANSGGVGNLLIAIKSCYGSINIGEASSNKIVHNFIAKASITKIISSKSIFKCRCISFI